MSCLSISSQSSGGRGQELLASSSSRGSPQASVLAAATSLRACARALAAACLCASRDIDIQSLRYRPQAWYPALVSRLVPSAAGNGTLLLPAVAFASSCFCQQEVLVWTVSAAIVAMPLL